MMERARSLLALANATMGPRKAGMGGGRGPPGLRVTRAGVRRACVRAQVRKARTGAGVTRAGHASMGGKDIPKAARLPPCKNCTVPCKKFHGFETIRPSRDSQRARAAQSQICDFLRNFTIGTPVALGTASPPDAGTSP